MFFFVALFVMVGALEATGAIEEVATAIKDLTGGDRTAELLGTTWIAGIGSGIVDNIPFTTAMIPVVDSLNTSDDDAYWWALSLGACFGGNMTVIAAAANVAASGLAERAGGRSASSPSSGRAAGDADQPRHCERLHRAALHRALIGPPLG